MYQQHIISIFTYFFKIKCSYVWRTHMSVFISGLKNVKAKKKKWNKNSCCRDGF